MKELYYCYQLQNDHNKKEIKEKALAFYYEINEFNKKSNLYSNIYNKYKIIFTQLFLKYLSLSSNQKRQSVLDSYNYVYGVHVPKYHQKKSKKIRFNSRIYTPKLPMEIINKITSFVQTLLGGVCYYSLLNLSLVNKVFSYSAREKLYQIIDLGSMQKFYSLLLSLELNLEYRNAKDSGLFSYTNNQVIHFFLLNFF
jgi:hypothetical protein